jgi:hypothetical protein
MCQGTSWFGESERRIGPTPIDFPPDQSDQDRFPKAPMPGFEPLDTPQPPRSDVPPKAAYSGNRLETAVRAIWALAATTLASTPEKAALTRFLGRRAADRGLRSRHLGHPAARTAKRQPGGGRIGS